MALQQSSLVQPTHTHIICTQQLGLVYKMILETVDVMSITEEISMLLVKIVFLTSKILTT